MSGSHWVSTYVKDNIINYFDSFGLPPFQEIVNHARRQNLTLLHQNNQIQNINITTCGYFRLYFLNEMNKGKTYFDLLKVFHIDDTMKNEKFIERYFKNIQSSYIYEILLSKTKKRSQNVFQGVKDITDITVQK